MNFQDLDLDESLLRALRAEGYTTPTPIQELAIPHLLKGRDLVGCAQTGTGKTAAFALPILQHLDASSRHADGPRSIRALVLAPTRELATQIAESFSIYGRYTGLTSTVIFGGVGQEPQTRALRRGVDILVATPGRLLDLMSQGYVRLGRLEILVLDEADRMLDMGFIHDVRRILSALPTTDRQTMLFSATIPEAIEELAARFMYRPERIEVTPEAPTPELIEQAVYFVEKGDKRSLLEYVLADRTVTRALVFTRTKHGADRVVRHLNRGTVKAEAIHGDKSQGNRERALHNFKSGSTRVLIATDIAARGLDIDGLSHVINFDLPNAAEGYVHRIGRTGRAHAAGIAVSFCGLEERSFLADIEKLIRMRIPVVAEHPYRSSISPPELRAAQPGQARRWSAGPSHRSGRTRLRRA